MRGALTAEAVGNRVVAAAGIRHAVVVQQMLRVGTRIRLG